MFSRVGAAAIKNGLGNTIALLEHLNNPHKKFKSIHIAGTNGKGSTSHMLAAIFQQNGYNTGLYTSPHLKNFTERIRVNGTEADKDFVIDFVEKIKPQIDLIEPSFFEITVAMAFCYFEQKKVDIAIIETGLGGRLDSTNVIMPILSIITNIAYDHTNLLGTQLDEIAFEKAGIIKEGIPVIIGQKHPETIKTFKQKAYDNKCQLVFAEDNFKLNNYFPDWQHSSFEIINCQSNSIEKYELDLPAIYQSKNLCTVLTALEILKENWNLMPLLIKSALAKTSAITGLLGRWQIINQAPKIILDVAHNPDGIQQLLAQIALLKPANVIMILGFVKDKDVEKVLEMLPTNFTYLFTQSHIERALPSNELKEIAASKNIRGENFDDVNMAIIKAIEIANIDDLIIVCGSIFLIAEVEPNTFK